MIDLDWSRDGDYQPILFAYGLRMWSDKFEKTRQWNWNCFWKIYPNPNKHSSKDIDPLSRYFFSITNHVCASDVHGLRKSIPKHSHLFLVTSLITWHCTMCLSNLVSDFFEIQQVGNWHIVVHFISWDPRCRSEYDGAGVNGTVFPNTATNSAISKKNSRKRFHYFWKSGRKQI